MASAVTVRVENLRLPTYCHGPVDPNPLFLEERIYQGSSGRVYPYGVVSTVSSERGERLYRAVFVENDFLEIMILPELGGRVHRAYDKIRKRDFIYYNSVIKPALVGLTGPWISGGLEFNWPQHHRPTTFAPVDETVRENTDGSKTVWVGEREPMHGLQAMTGFTLYADRAVLEIQCTIFNGNDTPRSFLWWANPAVKGGDYHQSVFPPDVTAVFDHGKRDVSSFPIARGNYYKVDYSAGVDISRYRNIPVPTSYMAAHSNYDFVGAYDHKADAGLLHVADHHVAPGKKQWTWGTCEFGRAWDRNLTDSDGPYVELMTGVYTDNQPDFTWLDPYEERSFVQNFFPYHSLGVVQNANARLALKAIRSESGVECGVYAAAPLAEARFRLSAHDGRTLFEEPIALAVGEVWRRAFEGEIGAGPFLAEVLDASDAALIQYPEHQTRSEPPPEPAVAPPQPADVKTIDELYFIGQHLAQYHHAARTPETYYLEGVRRDPLDYRCNLELARLAYDRADYARAIRHAEQALKRAHGLNKNPACGMASFTLGRAHERIGDLPRAYESYFRSTWSGNCRDCGYLGLARVSAKEGRFTQALAFCERSLDHNAVCLSALFVRACLRAKLGQRVQALQEIDALLYRYPLHYGLHLVRWLIEGGAASQDLRDIVARRTLNLIQAASDLIELGFFAEAQSCLGLAQTPFYLVDFYRAYLSRAQGELATTPQDAVLIERFAGEVLFPNSLTDVAVLSAFDDSALAQFLLGCFHYDRRAYEAAAACWMRSKTLAPTFPGSCRALSIYFANNAEDRHKARELIAEAFQRDSTDSRLLYEYDLIRGLCGEDVAARVALLRERRDLVFQRDDLTVELVRLLNLEGELDEARAILTNRIFHPWEGGEGRVTGEFIANCLRFAFRAMKRGETDRAIGWLTEALTFPANLNEGRLVGQTDNDIHYWLARCAERSGDRGEAERRYRLAATGKIELSESRYYNDPPVDYLLFKAMALRALGRTGEGNDLLVQMRRWSARQMSRAPETDFFAVSVPDLVVYKKDHKREHETFCLYVDALARLGQGDFAGSERNGEKILQLDPAHGRARMLAEFRPLVFA
jgi:tetratricopeptide (TPR) repeat protein